LTAQYGRSFEEKSLRRMMQFAHVFEEEQIVVDPFIETFSLSLTTNALNKCSIRWFETSSCKPVPRGPPSSLIQL